MGNIALPIVEVTTEIRESEERAKNLEAYRNLEAGDELRLTFALCTRRDADKSDSFGSGPRYNRDASNSFRVSTWTFSKAADATPTA